jgi:hypothetical protein
MSNLPTKLLRLIRTVLPIVMHLNSIGINLSLRRRSCAFPALNELRCRDVGSREVVLGTINEYRLARVNLDRANHQNGLQGSPAHCFFIDLATGAPLRG